MIFSVCSSMLLFVVIADELEQMGKSIETLQVIDSFRSSSS